MGVVRRGEGIANDDKLIKVLGRIGLGQQRSPPLAPKPKMSPTRFVPSLLGTSYISYSDKARLQDAGAPTPLLAGPDAITETKPDG